MTAPATTVPDWSLALVPAFERVLRSVERTPGFSLVPIEVAGPDVARALAAWLEAHGHRAHVVEPLDDAAWRGLVASLFDITAAEGDVVLVVGARKPPPGVYAGLRLLNQRRDSLVAHLDGPLLVCGPADFLALMWERAPDFWSIRALMQVVGGAGAAPPEALLWAGVVVRDRPERLREMLRVAREQSDPRVDTRVALQLCEALLASGEFDEAAELAEEMRTEGSASTPLQRGQMALVAARAALARGEEDRASASIAEAEALASAGLGADFDALLATAKGNVAIHRDRAGAITCYTRAVEAFRASLDARNEAVAIGNLGIAHLAAGDPALAATELEDALTRIRDVGDERTEARILLHLGRTHVALRDTRTANAYLDEALEQAHAQGDGRSEARVLVHLASVYLYDADAEKALEDARRAYALAAESGDARLTDRARALVRAAERASSDPPPFT